MSCGLKVHIPNVVCDNCDDMVAPVDVLSADVKELKTKDAANTSALTANVSDVTDLQSCCEQAHNAIANTYTKSEFDAIIKEALGGDPVILGLAETSVYVGDTFDPMDGVTAFDGKGNDITSDVVVTGTVDTSTEGEYTLTYTVTDRYGYTTTETRTVIVEALPELKTTLFTDGTLIINEKATDRAANIANHGAVTNEYAPGPYTFVSATNQPWNSQKANILNVDFGSDYTPTDCSYLFHGLINCTNIDLNKINTSNVTNMSYMFNSCQALTSLDVSNFDTSNVTNMQGMFANCYALTSLDVSDFDTSKVAGMMSMFSNCRALTTLDLSNFDTSNITSMRNMFTNCQALTSLDVSNFDTSSVTDVTNMFSDCQALTSLDVSNFDTSNVTSMQGMFANCNSLTTIYASALFTVVDVASASNMFRNCTSLVGGAGTVFNSSKITKEYARIDNPPDYPGYFTAKT